MLLIMLQKHWFQKHWPELRLCALIVAAMQAFTVIVLWAPICVSRMSWTIQPAGKAYSNITLGT